MQEQKKYHQRKLAIIEMIESCDDYIKREKSFIKRMSNYHGVVFTCQNSNINRYENIKAYLLNRYKN